jgi:hypothetical protein
VGIVSDQPIETPVVETVPPVADEATTPTQVTIRKSPKALSQRDPVVIAEHFYRSGFFPDVRSMSQAVVKIIAGEELGLPPMAAMQGLTMIEGRLGMTGNLVATKVRQHPTYDYKILERDNEHCKLAFYDGNELLGESEFTVEDAKKAGLVKTKSNWEKYPRAMCFNRALTEGVRTFIPDVTAGTPVYTTEEIEEVITQEPAPVTAEAVEQSGLPDDRVDNLLKGFEIAGPELGGVTPLDGLNVLLGSLGADGFDPSAELRLQFAALDGATADALDAEFQKAVEEEADGEVVDGGGDDE